MRKKESILSPNTQIASSISQVKDSLEERVHLIHTKDQLHKAGSMIKSPFLLNSLDLNVYIYNVIYHYKLIAKISGH